MPPAALPLSTARPGYRPKRLSSSTSNSHIGVPLFSAWSIAIFGIIEINGPLDALLTCRYTVPSVLR
jgi:hypothetical protein